MENILLTMSGNLFLEIGLMIILASLFAIVARLLKQPLIPAYVLVGIVLGPLGVGLIQDMEVIRTLSEIGIAFLLFVVGLEMNISKLKKVGFVAGVGGTIQVVLTFALGYGLALLLGFNSMNSVFLGLVLAFSSTMVVVKLLSDKNEISTLHGRIVLGILLMQDILVILVLSVIGDLSNVMVIFPALLKGVLLLAIVILLSKYVLGSLFRFAAKSQELLLLCSLAAVFVFSLLAVLLDFSIVVGAFLIGVGLASLPYNFDIIGRIKPLRDFFALIFFVSLGMEIVWLSNGALIPMLVFLGAIIILKPLIILVIISLFNYEKRTGFLTAISLGQISEFSLILISTGMALGYVNQEILSMTVIFAVVSITLTTYFIEYDNLLYKKMDWFLGVFEYLNTGKKRLGYVAKGTKKKVVIFGSHRIGSMVLNNLDKLKRGVLVVDYDPEIIEQLKEEKVSCMYGDISNVEILERIPWKDVKLVLSTAKSEEDNLFLIEYVKENYPKVKVIVTASHLDEALNLYEMGADYVVVPTISSGDLVSHLVGKFLDGGVDLKSMRNKHIKHLLNVELYGK